MNASSNQSPSSSIRELSNINSITGPVAWIGAVSFEDRCTASIERLRQANVRVSRVFTLDYNTRATPHDQDTNKRKRHQAIIEKAANRLAASSRILQIEPYAYRAIKDAIQEILPQLSPSVTMVLDITCMTKIHAIAVASMIFSIPHDVVIAYTSPENYPNPEQQGLAWRDIIIAPIAETASLFNEVHSRGIVITGLEFARLLISLSELEPSGGVIILPANTERPDFAAMNRRKNKRIIAHLSEEKGRLWKSEQIDLMDISKLISTVSREIVIAAEDKAPIIIFPAGPKMMIFVVSMLLAENYKDGGWFVYPIPSFYNLDYTEGSAATHWMQISRNK